MLPNPTLLGRWAFASVLVACLSSTRAVAQTPADQPSEPKFPSTKISGLMFGDYYWFNQSHRDTVSTTDPTSITELHGLWFRRLYFTFDYNYSERLTTRFRLEMNSNGDFTGDDLVPYVKDAYLKWTYTGEQQLTLGIQPTLTFNWLEELWGLRHIEKTPADLHRLDSSQGIVGFRTDAARVGGQYLWQTRKPGSDDPNLFFRVDGVEGDLGGIETGLPDAEAIDYWLLSSQSPFTVWIAGGEWFLHPSVRVGPNIEFVRYGKDPDPVNFPGRRQDSILRLTFFWTFG